MGLYNLYNIKNIYISSKDFSWFEEIGGYEFRENLTDVIMYCENNEKEACKRENRKLNVITLKSGRNSTNWDKFIINTSFVKTNYDSSMYDKLSKCKINDTKILKKFQNYCPNSKPSQGSYATFVYLNIFLLFFVNFY